MEGWQPKRDFDSPITALSGSKSHTHFTIYQSTQDAFPAASDIMPAFLSTQHQLVHIYGFPQSFNANPGQRSRSFFVRVFALQPVSCLLHDMKTVVLIFRGLVLEAEDLTPIKRLFGRASI